jgi:hypothetical protein
VSVCPRVRGQLRRHFLHTGCPRRMEPDTPVAFGGDLLGLDLRQDLLRAPSTAQISAGVGGTAEVIENARMDPVGPGRIWHRVYELRGRSSFRNLVLVHEPVLVHGEDGQQRPGLLTAALTTQKRPRIRKEAAALLCQRWRTNRKCVSAQAGDRRHTMTPF